MSRILLQTTGRRLRKFLGSQREIVDMPNLMDVQRASFDSFIQAGVPPEERIDAGLEGVLRGAFPIHDFNERAELEYLSYRLEEPKSTVVDCLRRGLTYGSPLKVKLRLVVWDIDEETGVRSYRDSKDQEIYLGDLPLMTENGAFIVNGTERVIVSQMHRSPGVSFDHDKGKTHTSGKYLYAGRIVPYRGSWVDFEFDAKDVLYVRIDRRKKLPVTTLLMALDSRRTEALRIKLDAEGLPPPTGELEGMTREEIIEEFYDTIMCRLRDEKWRREIKIERLRGLQMDEDLIDPDSGEILIEAGKKITLRQVRDLKETGVTEIHLSLESFLERRLAVDVVDPEDGRLLSEAGAFVTEEILKEFVRLGITEVPTLDTDPGADTPYIVETLEVDHNRTRDDALADLYRLMRPSDPPTRQSADESFRQLFFDLERYDLSAVGRVKMNSRLGIPSSEAPDTTRVLRKEDILRVLKKLVEIKNGKDDVDDIDHLGNRRVRSVGELIEHQYRIGLSRMERPIRERMNATEIDSIVPQDIVNAKSVVAAIREFFGSSQLSQFMDQTNPLSEVTHKRRVSALGPGGLTRERAGFEVRDIHPTHYGRICPVETPEGPNIGLINSLSVYSRINQYGFIETPYRKVLDGKLTEEVIYMSAMEEGKYTIAQGRSELDSDLGFVADLIPSRRGGETLMAQLTAVEFSDVSPKQVVSVAAALIPFLENDDANRALMGSNMQRQAVPLLHPQAPIVGTGMEGRVAADSGVTVLARWAGLVDQVDADRIVVRTSVDDEEDRAGADIYNLRKFQRSNQSTCINQRPLVRVGDRVDAGQILADGVATDRGELALGANVLVAFMPWQGYNFEDSVLVSERVIENDLFTSIHIEEFEIVARDTKLGPEEITRDIPNIGEDALRQLDEAGIIYLGAEVQAGDILVGKVTPKGETPMTPEEKLLRAIFGEKASEVRDSSLRLPPGAKGTVVEVRVFSRRGVDKDERGRMIEMEEIEHLAKDRDDERAILERSLRESLLEVLEGQVAVAGLPAGGLLIRAGLVDLSLHELRKMLVEDFSVNEKLERANRRFDEAIAGVTQKFEVGVEKIRQGDEMPPGVLKIVKVFVAMKRKMQPGDKVAGRHGNKGVISRILPVEDMPFLEDGTPVDMVLNPLGVPSRMNIGQILETHLGWASALIGEEIFTAAKALCAGTGSRDALQTAILKAFDERDLPDSLDDMSDEGLLTLSDLIGRQVTVATPVFDGASEDDINRMLISAGLDRSGQARMIDGQTGDVFERPVTVGYLYIMKLHHLVDDKIHARSIGPYSLVTQQPLGGKALFGGQRFGEMEVWALEAYGAAYLLQEILTVKSDDVVGRTRVYESIVRGDNSFEAGVPESFNVLTKELKALGLDVDLISSERQ